jgi:trans-2-enoyl-CoA reductase
MSSPTEEEKMSAIRKQLKCVDYVVYNDIDELRKGNTQREVWNSQLGSQRIISPFYLMKYIKQEWRNRIN